MKKKLLLPALVMLLVQAACLAQVRSVNGYSVPSFIFEEKITQIEAGDGIDIILQNENPGGLNAQVNENGLWNLDVKQENGILKLSRFSDLKNQERLTVTIYVNGNALRSMRLSGDAFATSIGILNIRNLTINLEDDAKIMLRNKGKLKVNLPDNYKLMDEEKYHLIYNAKK